MKFTRARPAVSRQMMRAFPLLLLLAACSRGVRKQMTPALTPAEMTGHVLSRATFGAAAAIAQPGATDVPRLFPAFAGSPLSTLFAPVL